MLVAVRRGEVRAEGTSAGLGLRHQDEGGGDAGALPHEVDAVAQEGRKQRLSLLQACVEVEMR